MNSELFMLYSMITVMYISCTFPLIYSIIWCIQYNLYYIIILPSIILFILYVLLPYKVISTHYEATVYDLIIVIYKYNQKIKQSRINRDFNIQIYEILLQNVQEKYLIDIIEEYSDIKFI